MEIAVILGGAFLLTLPLARDVPALLSAVSVYLIVAAGISYVTDRLSMRGVVWVAAQVSMVLTGTLWTALFVIELNLPGWMQAFSLAGIGLAIVGAGMTLVTSFAREAIFTHEYWRKPARAPERPLSNYRPKVSLQLPCYAEPPEIVKETMDSLAALDYDNFEVLVCDNNTKDEALWRPLEAHCATLNQKLGRDVFRFFHVAPLPGAKAGALNYLLDHMAPDAELIGVIDADYLSRKDFLSRLVPFFEDKGMAYIQTPHDYRAYRNSDYLTASYWEYMPSNKIDWPGTSEYGAAFTIGTMCLLRTQALRDVGGWAEWCLTEDSEISVRLRAAGYHGLYFGETFGRGLIPETFDDYRKQRFRWTAGPVQQLRRHWRLLLPAPFAPAMPGWSKLLEWTRCATPLVRLGGMASGLFAIFSMGLAVASDTVRPIDIPNIAWLLLLLGLATTTVRTIHRYRLSGCHSADEMILGEIARASLSYVVLQAGLAGLSKQPLAWRRTPKFAVSASRESPFASTMPETIAGGVAIAAALLALAGGSLWGHELAILTAFGFLAMGVSFLCAPLMAAMGFAHARRIAEGEGYTVPAWRARKVGPMSVPGWKAVGPAPTAPARIG